MVEFNWPSLRLPEPESYDYSSLSDLVDNIRILVCNERKDKILFGTDGKIRHLAIDYMADMELADPEKGVRVYCQGTFPDDEGFKLEGVDLYAAGTISINEFKETIQEVYSGKNSILPPMAVPTPLSKLMNGEADEIISKVEKTDKFIELNGKIQGSFGMLYSGTVRNEIKTDNSFGGYFYAKEDSVKFLLTFGKPRLCAEFGNTAYFPKGEFDNVINEQSIIFLSPKTEEFIVFNLERGKNVRQVLFGSDDTIVDFDIKDFFITNEIKGLDKALFMSKREDWISPKKLALISFDMRNLARLRDIDNMVF